MLEPHQLVLAYAAHELRAEIALQLTLAEAALADPETDMASLREMGRQVVSGCCRQARLLEALLALARSEHAQLRQEPVDLAAITARAVRANDHHRLTWRTSLAPARTLGDSRLIERLVVNLVDNAIGHNVDEGRIEVVTGTAAGRATLTISNTGALISTGELARLLQPFQRLGSDAACPDDGLGLGLSLVRAICDAHGAILTARPRQTGGLEISVAFTPQPLKARTPAGCGLAPQPS